MLYTAGEDADSARLVKSDGTRSDMNYISGQARDPMRRRRPDADARRRQHAGGGETGTPVSRRQRR
jgi:hypothetical protein